MSNVFGKFFLIVYLYFLFTVRNVQTKQEPNRGAVLQVLVSAALVSDCKMNTESWLLMGLEYSLI